MNASGIARRSPSGSAPANLTLASEVSNAPMSKSLPKRGAAGPARANEAACTQAPMSPARPVGPRPAAQLLAAQRQLGNQAALQMLQAAGASRPVSSGGPVMQMLRVPTQSQSLKGLLGEQYGVQIEALQGEGRSTSKLDAILEKEKTCPPKRLNKLAKRPWMRRPHRSA